MSSLLGLVACGGGGGGAVGPPPVTNDLTLTAVHYGRLVDVYALRRSAQGVTVELYQNDVMVGPDIQDERDGNSRKTDQEITYDFLSSNPDTLQPRLLITRELGTRDFDLAFAALDAKLRLVTPGRFGQSTSVQPFSVVPRNAGIRLTFSKPLPVGDDFFVTRDAQGRVTGLKNTEAVQLLKIVGDPWDSNGNGDFQVITSRIVVRGNQIIVDPVLLGSEGIQYQTRNNAAGMPEAPDQSGANIRLALATEGPLRIPNLKADASSLLNGTNNSNVKSVIRDFRSGNRNDSSSDLSQGFARDPLPPRIVGEIVMYVERVDALNDFSQVLTLYKNGVNHEIDRGDVVRVVTDNSGVPVAVTEVVADPDDDLGEPSVQHVRVIVRRTPGLEENDPSNRPDYPVAIRDREPWLVANAPRGVLVCEFTAEREHPVTHLPYGDNEKYFLTFTPAPLPRFDGTPSDPNENISPHAGVIVRFTKPVDMATVKSLDTYYFGMRDMLEPDLLTKLQADINVPNIDENSFLREKFITPHLVYARVFDEDGSQTSLRLQPALGFFLNDAMRTAPDPNKYRYYLHLVGSQKGIRDLSGNPIDFQVYQSVRDSLTIPFKLDVRRNSNNAPLFDENLSVTVARRFKLDDEDEQPNYYLPTEVQRKRPPADLEPKAYNLQDLFGAVVVLADGKLQARPTTRTRAIADDLNQVPPPPQGTSSNPNPFRFCPLVLGEEQIATGTATVRFGQPLQNPLNPFGCRLHTVWREIDLSLSRTDPYDFNLDVEQMYWAPFTAAPITYDIFDQITLYLGHSERRPEPCIQIFGALPSMPDSGLNPPFENNYIHNQTLSNQRETQPNRHEAYVDKELLIDQNLAFTEPNGVNRYLPLPKFQKPYFVWRDETVLEQGCNARVGVDTLRGAPGFDEAYIISPFLNGGGRYVTLESGRFRFNNGKWNNSDNYFIVAGQSRPDPMTEGLLGSIAQPLLADFWTWPDSEVKPLDNPFRASGANGWQISLTVQSAPQPNFRSYSGGGLVQGQPRYENPSSSGWVNAAGGYTPQGARTISGDNTFYWIMVDFLKRQAIATNGFVEIDDPHRMTGSPFQDARLGPYYVRDAQGRSTRPFGVVPRFDFQFEPPLDTLPGGTSVTAEFRAAGPVDGTPWYWDKNLRTTPVTSPDVVNFPLDPLKAGDAHIRKFDDRSFGAGARNGWTHFYNRNVTTYLTDPNGLFDVAFLQRFAAPTESFGRADVSYINWRFLMKNNVDANPPVSPTIDSFAMTYRFERR